MSDPLDRQKQNEDRQNPNESSSRAESAWLNKFGFAFSGAAWAVRTQSSFSVHVPVAIIVLATAAFLEVEPWRWAVLILAVAVVISAELFNTALEQMVAVLHPENDQRVGHALDAAAAAVLVPAIASVVVGLIVLIPPLIQWFTMFGR